ncbi:MAG: hypothetical protein GY854_33250 [Deltaproteobacteria bacterium]|nr:hypothetical protein [Deltaproteobacteria bacterium]
MLFFGRLRPDLGCRQKVLCGKDRPKTEKIEKGGYERTLLAIQNALEGIDTILGRRRAVHWAELAKIAATVLAVFNGFLLLLQNLGLIAQNLGLIAALALA